MISSLASEFVASPFHWTGREGQTPRFLILHGTAGGSSAQGVAAWFQNAQAQASTHYIIGQDGYVVACVDEDNAAWSNGALTTGHTPFWDTLNGVNPNLVTIAIEHVKPSTDNSDALTPVQQEVSFKLIDDICTRWNIPKRLADAHGGIAAHASLDPVNREFCPGTYSWQALFAFLNPVPQIHNQPTQGDEDVNMTLQHIVPNNAMAEQAQSVWKANKSITVLDNSGIFQAWAQALFNGKGLGIPVTEEYESNDWNGNPIIRQDFSGGHAEWHNNTCRLFVSGIGELVFI